MLWNSTRIVITRISFSKSNIHCSYLPKAIVITLYTHCLHLMISPHLILSFVFHARQLSTMLTSYKYPQPIQTQPSYACPSFSCKTKKLENTTVPRISQTIIQQKTKIHKPDINQRTTPSSNKTLPKPRNKNSTSPTPVHSETHTHQYKTSIKRNSQEPIIIILKPKPSISTRNLIQNYLNFITKTLNPKPRNDESKLKPLKPQYPFDQHTTKFT